MKKVKREAAAQRRPNPSHDSKHKGAFLMFQPTACAPRILRTLDEICETFGVGRKTVRA